VSFATAEDVATRLGRSLSATEAGTAEMLLAGATGLIAQAADQTDAWADALEPVPQMLAMLTIEIVARAMLNPQGASTVSEQLGAYQSTMSWTTGDGDSFGLYLSRVEERLVRRTLGLADVASLVIRSPTSLRSST
jgi:hypothetical protein